MCCRFFGSESGSVSHGVGPGDSCLSPLCSSEETLQQVQGGLDTVVVMSSVTSVIVMLGVKTMKVIIMMTITKRTPLLNSEPQLVGNEVMNEDSVIDLNVNRVYVSIISLITV